MDTYVPKTYGDVYEFDLVPEVVMRASKRIEARFIVRDVLQGLGDDVLTTSYLPAYSISFRQSVRYQEGAARDVRRLYAWSGVNFLSVTDANPIHFLPLRSATRARLRQTFCPDVRVRYLE